MFTRYIMLILTCAVTLFGQGKPETQLELEATVRKIGIAAPPAQVFNLMDEQVQREYTETLRKDLEHIEALAVLRRGLPVSISPDSFPQWLDAGCDWLLTSRVSQTAGTNVSVEAVVFDVKSGRRVISTTQSGTTSNYRRLAHLVADAIQEFLTGSPGVANSRIIFSKEDAPGIKEIYQVDKDGSNLIKLTNHNALSISPSMSRDGKLAYLCYKPRPTIWGQKVPGGPHVRIYPLSDDSAFNVYTPVWNPDGKRIAFVQTDGRGNTDVMLLEVVSGRVRRLTSLNGINSELCWNPAGNRLAFSSGRGGSPQIYIMDDDGTNVRMLDMGGTYNSSPAWSPDGSMIAFVSRFEGNFDLFVYRFGEQYPFQITTGFKSSENPAWAPDSRQLIFSSSREGRNRLYITDLSGNRVERALNQTGCQQPVWIR